jgi:PAS domain S-box-containing protein
MNPNRNLFPGHSTTSADLEDLYQKMIEEVDDYAILLMDKNGYIINWNKGVEKIKGYKEHEIISKHFSIFYTNEDLQNHLPEKLLELGAKSGKACHEGWRVRKDGSTFWGSVLITAIHHDNGDILGFTKVTRDLTERKLAEESAKAISIELQKANKDLLIIQQELKNSIAELNSANKDLEQFAYIASHDLQEPVRKISTYFSMLCHLIKDKLDPKAKDLTEKIIYSTKRMQTLINDLLTLSTINENLVLAPVDLNKILKNVLEDLDMRISEKKAAIEVTALPVVAGIESYLIQLFLNLISNSLKFSNNAPVIRISADIIGQNAVIKIQDNGIGMEDQHLHKIFEAFQRLHPKHKYEGTGIGLTICKKIIETLHGKIEVESQIGVGTTFIITLTTA